MAFRKNTNIRNVEAAAIMAEFNGGTLQIRTGTQPASANSSASGTLLGTITLPNPCVGSASGGSVALAGSWTTTAVATGTAGWGRFISASGDRRLDVSIAESGADLDIDNDAIETGGTITVTAFSLGTASGE
jgi:hypothetical protein